MSVLVIDGQKIPSIDGLTPAQQVAVEMGVRCAPASWHDNVVDDIAAALPGSAPYANSDVTATMLAVLTSLGVASPLLPAS